MPFQGASCRHFQHLPGSRIPSTSRIPNPLLSWRLVGLDSGSMIRIEKGCQSERQAFRLTEEFLMCKSTVASPQSRMPDGQTLSIFGAILKALGTSLSQLTMQKMNKHTTMEIPATIVGRTIVQAFFGNVQPGYIYSISVTCFVVVSSRDSCASLTRLLTGEWCIKCGFSEPMPRTSSENTNLTGKLPAGILSLNQQDRV